MLFFTFFFFKQKTAYEMRISDWSSDVCSSDLTDARGAAQRFSRRQPGLFRRRDRARQQPRRTGEERRAGDRPHRAGRRARTDRKSVVSGKSVSVRVDLGGRRIIKKKTKKDNINESIKNTKGATICTNNK